MIFQKRSQFIQKIDKFWHVVLSQHPEFAEFVRAEDFKYIELIKDIYVEWEASRKDDDSVNPGNFSITFKFAKSEENDNFSEQEVTKNFQFEQLDQEELIKNNVSSKNSKTYSTQNDSEDNDDDFDLTEKLISTDTGIIWPKSYYAINPSFIQDKKSQQGKKNYRTGMKSFFGWFKWTGRKPGKEFPNGDEFAKLLSEDIFPNAVKYYTEAQRDGLEEEIDSDASEPLDLSDEDDEENTSQGTKRKLEDI